MLSKLSGKRWLGYGAAVIGIAGAAWSLKLLGAQVNPTTVALAFLLIILFVATAWGSRPAVLASLLGVVCFNFLFLPPFGTFAISDPHNWIAFVAFLITALTVGQLSARAKRRAEEAEIARAEIERVYRELQDTFERASEAKALKQSEQLKSALLDAVTHDLRTPLTSIKASVTTLLEEFEAKHEGEEAITLEPDARKEMLVVINEEADRLNHFVEDLMKLAQIKAGEMQLRKHWGSVEEIVTAALMRAAPRTRDHEIDISLADELPSVRVDERAVAEVLYNLLENAAKYSPPGSAIRVKASTRDDGTVKISVEDEGHGIPVDLRERVFDRFFRAMRSSNASWNQPSGTGMGLAIARGITEAHEGRIWIENTDDGRGARVVFTLPIGDEEQATDDATGIGHDTDI
ncbi:MAG TPA: ATP-binding protein [Pyrinomonadaceae bacterium]|nr:ATP-binding protein [Pyrinomonadaceae bacterium]